MDKRGTAAVGRAGPPPGHLQADGRVAIAAARSPGRAAYK